MSKKLVAYFSASGITKELAGKVSKAASAELYEIKPQIPYTEEDLNWRSFTSRSSVEMNDRSIRPAAVTGDVNICGYDVIFLGFPIWWYVAPTIVNTFLEAYDFTGKKIVLFATSGGSGFGNTIVELQPSAPDSRMKEGLVICGGYGEEEVMQIVAAQY